MLGGRRYRGTLEVEGPQAVGDQARESDEGVALPAREGLRPVEDQHAPTPAAALSPTTCTLSPTAR